MKRQMVYGILAILLLALVFYGLTGNAVQGWIFGEDSPEEQLTDAIVSQEGFKQEQVPITELAVKVPDAYKNTLMGLSIIGVSEPLVGMAMVATPAKIKEETLYDAVFVSDVNVKGGKK